MIQILAHIIGTILLVAPIAIIVFADIKMWQLGTKIRDYNDRAEHARRERIRKAREGRWSNLDG